MRYGNGYSSIMLITSTYEMKYHIEFWVLDIETETSLAILCQMERIILS